MCRRMRAALGRVDWLIFFVAITISASLSYWLRYHHGSAASDACVLPLFPDPIARDRYNRCLEINRGLQDLTDESKGGNHWVDSGD